MRYDRKSLPDRAEARISWALRDSNPRPLPCKSPSAPGRARSDRSGAGHSAAVSALVGSCRPLPPAWSSKRSSKVASKRWLRDGVSRSPLHGPALARTRPGRWCTRSPAICGSPTAAQPTFPRLGPSPPASGVFGTTAGMTATRRRRPREAETRPPERRSSTAPYRNGSPDLPDSTRSRARLPQGTKEIFGARHGCRLSAHRALPIRRPPSRHLFGRRAS